MCSKPGTLFSLFPLGAFPIITVCLPFAGPRRSLPTSSATELSREVAAAGPPKVSKEATNLSICRGYRLGIVLRSVLTRGRSQLHPPLLHFSRSMDFWDRPRSPALCRLVTFGRESRPHFSLSRRLFPLPPNKCPTGQVAESNATTSGLGS